MATTRMHAAVPGACDNNLSPSVSAKLLTEAISRTLKTRRNLDTCEDGRCSQESAVSVGRYQSEYTISGELTVSSFQNSFDGLSEYSLDPQRVSFGPDSETSTSRGGFGDVKRGTLIASDKDPDRSVPVAVKILRVGDNISPLTLQASGKNPVAL